MSSSGLGNFGKLPPEIRFMIWSDFVPSGHERSKTDLSILRASKQLHAEVLSYLHETISTLAIVVRAEFDELHQLVDSSTHLSFEIWSGGALLRRNGDDGDDVESEMERLARASRWKFSSARDALERGFEFLPLDKLSAIMCIDAPDPDDEGQLICLCLRMRQVALLLKSLRKPISHVGVRLGEPRAWRRKKGERVEEEEEESEDSDDDNDDDDDDDDSDDDDDNGEEDDSEGGEEEMDEEEDEQQEGVVEEQMEEDTDEKEDEEAKLQFSLEDMFLPDLAFIQTDIQAVLFPLYSLENVDLFLFNTADAPLLFPTVSPDAFDCVPAIILGWNDMYHYWLHTRLDCAEGDTAFTVRLDRFAMWQEEKYDDLFLEMLKRYPIQLDVLDENGLDGVRRRYVYAHTLRYFISRRTLEDLPRDIDLRTIAPNIPPRHWVNIFPGGLLPLEIDEFSPYAGHDFWFEFEDYASDWHSRQMSLQFRQEEQEDPSANLPGMDAFAKAVSDAQNEVELLMDDDPFTVERTIEKFGIRRSDW
ncbi:hypothetical protein TSTA_073930 [Talaromyces stipitatus ATCC 10500]|uniref:Uncharacterized protein n=1 Tax=Talaromyces stipitatus (strain ATCC 10500 / CBS 375.48 / QM 6759 / NRRL 1006) TaxID=441959 RepID=B8LVI8_TALSN|nr:uncharacterized protein TSTA_073930 [Talaromyces stipitatus ATCC 10500]EED24007.1 hypothetical protein TSTA_073930 [Talaromyces stipitatus ATCC 10500]